MKYDISVIIPVKSDCLLDQALASISDDVEVIVSLNQPSQEVKVICDKWMKDTSRGFVLKIITTDKVGMPVALNNGVRAARYDKIVVLDSDCMLEKNTLYFYQKQLNEHAFVRGSTKVKEKDGFWYRQTKLGVESVNEAMRNEAKLYGPSIAFQKKDFLSLKGYDEDILYGCDHKFSDSIIEKGYAVHFCEQAVVWHAPISYAIDRSSHIGYGRGNKVHDQKSNSRSGLAFIFSKIAPSTLIHKLRKRGPGAMVRTVMQFVWMIRGYMA